MTQFISLTVVVRPPQLLSANPAWLGVLSLPSYRLPVDALGHLSLERLTYDPVICKHVLKAPAHCTVVGERKQRHSVALLSTELADNASLLEVFPI
jgi:hypothetical protein